MRLIIVFLCVPAFAGSVEAKPSYPLPRPTVEESDAYDQCEWASCASAGAAVDTPGGCVGAVRRRLLQL